MEDQARQKTLTLLLPAPQTGVFSPVSRQFPGAKCSSPAAPGHLPHFSSLLPGAGSPLHFVSRQPQEKAGSCCFPQSQEVKNSEGEKASGSPLPPTTCSAWDSSHSRSAINCYLCSSWRFSAAPCPPPTPRDRKTQRAGSISWAARVLWILSGKAVSSIFTTMTFRQNRT